MVTDEGDDDDSECIFLHPPAEIPYTPLWMRNLGRILPSHPYPADKSSSNIKEILKSRISQ